MFRPRSLTVALVLLLIPALPVRADRIDDLVRAEMERQSIPGVSVAVVRRGKLVKAKGYGLANVELGAPATADTVYQIASVSKQFVAAGIMLLAEEGKVSVDDPLRKHLPDVPRSWERIRLRHLLTHTSGITVSLEQWGAAQELPDAEIVKAAGAAPVRFQPGERWEYNSIGYHLLGLVIQRHTGKPWQELLAERVFRPLGMDSTRARSPGDVVRNRAGGYTRASGTLKNAAYMGESRSRSGSGGLLSTVTDLARWDAALYRDRPLSRAAQGRMAEPVTLADGSTFPYGFGWGLGDFRGQRSIAHGGYTNGFRAAFARYPELELTVVVLLNLQEADPDRIAGSVAGLVEPRLIPLRMLEPAADPDPKMTEGMRAARHALATGEGDAGLTPELRKAAPDFRPMFQGAGKEVRKLRFLARDLPADGAVRRFGVPVAEIRHYRVETEQGTFYESYFLTADGRLADLDSSKG